MEPKSRLSAHIRAEICNQPAEGSVGSVTWFTAMARYQVPLLVNRSIPRSVMALPNSRWDTSASPDLLHHPEKVP